MTPPPPDAREWFHGGSCFRLEQPDLLRVKLLGGGSLPEVMKTVDLYRELAAACPFFVLADMQDASPLESDAREYIDKHVQPEWILGFIYFNTRLLHRATAMGMLLAYELVHLKKHIWRDKIHFVSTEDQGRTLHARLSAPQPLP